DGYNGRDNVEWMDTYRALEGLHLREVFGSENGYKAKQSSIPVRLSNGVRFGMDTFYKELDNTARAKLVEERVVDFDEITKENLEEKTYTRRDKIFEVTKESQEVAKRLGFP